MLGTHRMNMRIFFYHLHYRNSLEGQHANNFRFDAWQLDVKSQLFVLKYLIYNSYSCKTFNVLISNVSVVKNGDGMLMRETMAW